MDNIFLQHKSGRMDNLAGQRFSKLRKEILAGRGGPEVTVLVASEYVGFLAHTGEVHDFEDLGNELRRAS